jgi:hypothetical protein
VLVVHPSVASVEPEAGALIVVLRTGSADETDAVVGDLVRRLVAVDIGVYAVEPRRVSLEERFLEITSRLESTA